MIVRCTDANHFINADRVFEAFDFGQPEAAEFEVALDQSARFIADGDAAGRRGALHTLGQVDRVADGRVLGVATGLHTAHYDFASVDADADFDASAARCS